MLSHTRKRMRENTRINVSVRVGKNRKLDPILKVECGNILKELMNRPAGWVFSEPVDPVKLHIPDYFSLVSKPMDLGTVKGKLDIYSCADEFFDDVKLTFANAILYNPGWNRVHHLAKQLDSLFCKRWKRFEADRKRKKDSDNEFVRKRSKKDLSIGQGFCIQPCTVGAGSKDDSTRAASSASVANVQKRKRDSVDDSKLDSAAAASIIMSTSNVKEMSLNISLRAAMLKSRFADTILKAKLQLQQHKGSTEERRFESEEEKVKERKRIEEEFRAAQKEDLKRRRKIERMALEHMEKSVRINDDNAHLLKKLESLCGDSAFDLFYGKVTTASNCVVVNPLEKLGLYLKEDDYYYFEDEELLVIEDELEEGEIR
ncbi:PREDICTED: transcription factor GTE8-like [Erythranthe guttata]|uniref:transcription factor GTE8-like n=1 Tax=Erythranthe guttata TaxID=4155 RepID=UPI00064D7D8B|nr:PREDICTED: transcription factor GTE8-like [Erythranthe guttata]|eukprot:XP_012858926.1 PREDICTED: transcription factor GTE8-like [Erythranthe guttata]